MPIEWRGGFPVPQRVTAIDTAGGPIVPQISPAVRVTTKWLRIAVTGANDVRIFWNQDDFDNDENYTTIPAGDVFREPVEITKIWAKSAAATTDIEILALHRGS